MTDLNETSFLGIFHQKAMPDGATPVKDFDVKKYAGTWYEIGRYDFFWEPHRMSDVTATYTLADDGSVGVDNKGYDDKSDKWKEWHGKAELRTDGSVGALSVSFFPGINAGYNVISVDDDYHAALVAGRNTDFLWILSRTTELPENIKQKYLKMAEELGYDISKLHWTSQERNAEKLGKEAAPAA